MNTIYHIDENQKHLDKAVGITEDALKAVSKKLSDITNQVVTEERTIGWVAKQIAEVWTEEEALLATSMFIASTINGPEHGECVEALAHIAMLEKLLSMVAKMKDTDTFHTVSKN